MFILTKSYNLNIRVFKKAAFACTFLLFFVFSSKAQLIINEISQGPSGAKEYVEFLVVGTPSCSSIPCVDLRGYYIDDNNGHQASGTGTGIAQGCIRFKNTSFWSCIPIGTLIVVYNDNDANASIPANDLSMTDGNCKLVIPASNCSLLEMNTDSPSLSSAAYPTTSFSACGDWAALAMANGDDSFQTVDASGNAVFSVSWGNNTDNPVIYFSGTSTASVAYMANATNNNPNAQSNWTRVSTAGNETPGAPNNPANAAWISSMSNSCTPITPLSLTTSKTNPGCTCDGAITVTATGGAGSYTYSWAPSGGSTATASGLCAGTYTVTVTTAGGCSQTATATLVANNTSINVNVNDVTTCSGQSATLTATGATSYVWSTGATTASITKSPTSTQTYTVTGTSNGCTGTATGTITIASALTVSVNSVTTCSGQSATLTATGADDYVWSTGATTASITKSPVSTQTYTVTGTSNGCSGTATGTITISGALSVSVNSVTTCTGSSATLTATGATSYLWSTGATTASISETPSSTETYTVTGTSNGCSGTATGTITIAGALSVSVNSVTTCTGSSATLTATGATSYLWSTGATTSSITESPSSTETYTVTGTSNGCSGTATGTITIAGALSVSVNSVTTCAGQSATLTATGASDYLWSTGATTASITESPLSTETFTVTAVSNGCSGTATGTITIGSTLAVSVNSVITCAGQAATLTATGADDYFWSTGATASTITESPLSTETYTVTGTSNGCSGTASGTITVGAVLTLSVNSATVCVGEAATLTATGADAYVWSTGATSSAITESPLTNTTYTVTGTSSGCTGTATATIQLNDSPVVAFSAGVLSGCDTFCTNFTDASVLSGGAILSWNWDFGDGESSDLQFPQHCFNTEGMYSVSLTVSGSNGCNASTTTSNMINLGAKPVADFAVPASISILEPEVAFADNSTNADSWTWNFGDSSDTLNNTSTASNPTHVYSEQGNYCALLTVANNGGCKDTSLQCFEIKTEYTFYVPNTFSPNGDGKNDEFYGKGEGILEFRMIIYDRWGVIVFKSEDINEHWDGKPLKGSRTSQQDSYVYDIVIRDTQKERHQYTGNIIVAR